MDLRELGYVVLGSADLPKWRFFAEQIIGMKASDGPNGELYLKIDQRHHRFVILPEAKERYVASGWATKSKTEFARAQQELTAAGVAVTMGAAADCAVRKVQEFFTFKDPAGNPQEVFWGPISDFKPFISPIAAGKFVTGELGLGHTVLPALNIDETLQFWTTVGGMEMSDSLLQPVTADLIVQLYFMHCRNARQHSLALAQMPSDVGCIHVMVEFDDMDDVGRALDRVHENKVPLAMTMGRHVNDDMISFYVMTPGNFLMEVGFGGPKKNWDNELFFETTAGSHWGHKWVLSDPNFQTA